MIALRRILAGLTPGARWLLGCWTAGCVLHFSPFESQLTLIAPAVRHGQLWRLVTYPWVPNSLVDFVLSGFALGILGGLLERKWSARTLLCYSLVVVVMTGATWAVLPFARTGSWHGAGALFFGLLAAWGRTCCDQPIYIAPVAQMTAMTAALVFGGISLLVTGLTAGWTSALFAGLGAVWGLSYLWVRSQQGELAARPAASSKRMSRLEL